MPLPVVADHFRTISEFTNTAAGTPWTVSMDFDASGAVGVIDDEAVGQGVLGAWIAFFAADWGTGTVADRFHEDVELAKVTVYDLTGEKAPYEGTPLIAPGGSNGTVPMPPDIAIVVSKRTATRGRRGRGRMYLAGMAQSAANFDGFVADNADLGAAANAAFATISVGESGSEEDIPMVVISQATNPLGTPFPITNLIVDQHFDVQRRRGRG